MAHTTAKEKCGGVRVLGETRRGVGLRLCGAITHQGAMHVFNCLMGDLTIILFIIEWVKPDVRVVRFTVTAHPPTHAPAQLCSCTSARCGIGCTL